MFPEGANHILPGGRAVAARILAVDPRCKLGLAVLCVVLVWTAGWPGLLACALFGFAALAALWSASAAWRGLPGIYAAFLAFWLLVKCVADVLGGADMSVVVVSAAWLGARLGVLLLVGLLLAFSMSSRQLGLALAWTLRPVLRGNAWQAALALSLLVHFLPLIWSTEGEVRGVMRRRVPHLSFLRRFTLLPLAVMRALSQKTWHQALAVASRRLDRPEAWRLDGAPRSSDLWACLGLALLLAGLSLL